MKLQRSMAAKWSLHASLVMGLVLMVLLVFVVPSQAGTAGSTDASNIIVNPGFESGVQAWECSQCSLTGDTQASAETAAGQMVSGSGTERAQLYQSNLSLQPDTDYELTFWAKSDGNDLQVELRQQALPETNYGLNETFDITSEWQQFRTTLTTVGFNSAVSDASLRFQAPQGQGFTFSIDDVSLSAVNGTAIEPIAAAAGGREMVVFDWNKPVTVQERGFPWDKPPKGFANSNWTVPPHYDKGTFHVRAVMLSARAPRIDMKVQFCIWQNRSIVENCTKTTLFEDRAGAVTAYSQKVQEIWKKNGRIINWAQPRSRNGFAIKTLNGKPVSNFSNWNWNGQNPSQWYPMDARFTVVVTAPGAQFSGWQNYPID